MFICVHFDQYCDRRHIIHRDTLTAASAIYKGTFSYLFFVVYNCLGSTAELHGNEDGTVPATFQVVFMVCYWIPGL
jgi:hypothetical protein